MVTTAGTKSTRTIDTTNERGLYALPNFGAEATKITQTDEIHSMECIDTKEVSSTPTPPPRIDLRDLHAVRRELAAVYRNMRTARIPIQDGTRLAFVLDLIRKAFDTALLQDRVQILEQALEHRGRFQ